jgi:AraC-like DNA-binding protein
MKPGIAYRSSETPGLEALSCESSFNFKDHLHNGYVLWVNSGGGERFQLKGHSDILQPGCISVIEPGVVHSNGPVLKSNRHLRSFYLGKDFFHHLDKLFTGYGDRTLCLPSSIIDHQQHWQQTIALHELIITGAEQMLVEERLIPLFSCLADATFTATFDIAGTGNARKTLDRVVEYMRSMLQENLSLEMLAVIAGCTSFHLMRLFKKHLGMSPHSYLVQLRLERAKELLSQGHPIADAALCAGFSDQSHLTRRFKQRYGLTPGTYLQQKLH